MKRLFHMTAIALLGLALAVPAAAQQDRGSRGRGKQPVDVPSERKGGDSARPRNDNGGNRERGRGQNRGRDNRDGERGEGGKRGERPNDFDF